ncbi:TIGR03087 family PEP-CTERM/XrtA system glycosyltransferase [Aestuariirhabdus sp. Z084]|uniref:TIGR03087 family PEP-CTERM/XrtA system glycosyltransferase n=1 Tax=Aestuariirhabdus haliotis TaxID=2918751 RepID=UPI00201B42A2|nr:TIGR03087 family PEP-CTERM/XrtA system glycosyltransferase [Aestuariirhabdus haliotis]MCL6414681.1 TIGR03087 family PEP-CTERM/XrtA system glycosyltransferase [Aestuariirhabdus haliotis]MCL6418613.1 TIGR03087 family PEP-CTERM/XrtA system glycosyltransferase [Aestuariirhabdus haliotis]
MESVIFVVHRIPFPPNKGDKIRSYQILKALASRYKVKLFCFVDDSADLKYEGDLNKFADKVYVEYLPKWRVLLRAAKSIFLGKSITEMVYQSNLMSQAVSSEFDQGASAVIAFSSSMGQYLPESSGVVKQVVDFVDVDSLKWHDYAHKKPFYLTWLYRREADLLSKLEIRLFQEGAISTFVTNSERDLFLKMLTGSTDRVKVVGNGVDTAFFDPCIEYQSPYQALGLGVDQSICFVGAMDYYANEDAVMWFASNVLPLILSKYPNCTFFIVGRNPSKRLQQFARFTPGVLVTGAVSDVRPYLQYCSLVVAPLRIARGMQNKILEALSMNKHVVASSEAAQGVDIDSTSNCLYACETKGGMAERIITLMSDKAAVCDGREQVLKHYSWGPQMDRLLGELET